MSFNPQQMATELAAIFTKAQIQDLTMCMTRLRVTVCKREQLDFAALKQVSGVMGVVENDGQIQVVIGPGKVNQVYQQLQELIALQAHQTTVPPVQATAKLSDVAVKQPLLHPPIADFKLLLKRLANIFVPLIPAFIGCGLILGLSSILIRLLAGQVFLGVAIEQSSYLAIARLLGSAIVFALAILVGVNTAKEFGGTPALGGVLAASLTMPDLAKISVFGHLATPGRGGVIAVLLVCGCGAWLERRLRRLVPTALDLFVTPTLVLLITGVLAILILQPLGGVISDWISWGARAAVEQGGAVAGFILSACFLPLVMTGLHQGLIPIHAELIKTSGMTILLPILAMGGAGQVGAALAVWLKTNNAKLKQIIQSSIIVGFLGVGEPLIYGVTLPLGRPFVAACLGGGLGGAWVASFKLGATGIGISGLPLTLLIHNGMLLYLAGILIAYLGGFVATMVLGFDDSILGE